jgi:hypothetical protein
MARAVHTALLRQKGPWLIRREQLERLDEILARSAAATEQSAAPEPPRRLEVFLNHGKKLLASSFREALGSYPSLERGVAIGFKYVVTVGAATAVVWLEKTDKPATGAPAPDTDHDLVVEVTPEDLPAAQSLFFALVEWAEAVQMPKRDRYFERYAGWLVVLALMAWSQVSGSQPASGDYYKGQARELLASGGTVDHGKAIALLLSIASEAPVPTNVPAKLPIGPEYYRWLLVAILCSLATLHVMLSPRILLGLGRGEARIAFWERARVALLYSVPATLVTWFALPPVLRLLGVP